MNYNKGTIIAMAVIVVISLTGLAYHFYSVEEQKESTPLGAENELTLLYIATSGEQYVPVEHDDILNVTCWKSSMLSRSCIPDNQLDTGAQKKLAELNKSKN